jgi:hypothetical protein
LTRGVGLGSGIGQISVRFEIFSIHIGPPIFCLFQNNVEETQGSMGLGMTFCLRDDPFVRKPECLRVLGMYFLFEVMFLILGKG